MNLVPSAHFVRDIRKLEKGNSKLKERIRKQLYQLHINPAHPSLRFHKLEGKETYSVSVSMDIRIIFSLRGDTIYLLRIGSHEDVY